MTSFLTLQSVDTVLGYTRLFAPLEAEHIPLTQAFGRVLAEPCIAPENVPGFTRSTMDGFAVQASSVFGASEGSPALLDYLGECPMALAPTLLIGPGQCARIWTGGMLPEGADAVVMLEYARLAGNQVELTKPVAPFDNCIQAGEDAAKGALLLAPGTELRPQEIGLLAALGQGSVCVKQKPKVAILSSGDEVLPIEATPGLGQVRDINSYTLAALVASAGAEYRTFGIANDDKAVLTKLVHKALEYADCVLLSGGSSAGQRDFTMEVLASIPGAQILAHGVAISPGKPLVLAKAGNKSLWGLPGHAASALVCAEVFIRPLLRTLLGLPEAPPVWQSCLKAALTRPVSSAQGRRDYIRVALLPPAEANAPMQARPILGKSGLISTLVAANALVICPEDQEGLSAGEIVDVFLLP